MSKEAMTEFQDPFSEEIWRSTYKHHEDKDINDTFRRVARAIAEAEETEELRQEWAEKFYDMFTGFKVIPGGRILSNAGTEWSGTTMINCFVSPRPSKGVDSLEGIVANLRNQALTLKAEGGWGENFSNLRPRGSMIYGIGVESPGAVKYMELFDKSSEIVTSGSGVKSKNAKAKGKIRKGAMMAVLDVTHGDIVEFITAKQHSDRLTKFNMSVNCTDEFMNKVIEAERLRSVGATKEEIDEVDKWDLRFPDTTFEKYNDEWDGFLANWEKKGYPVVVNRTVSATWLWDLIMKSTYSRNEPGVLFLDKANYFNPLNYKETIQATNPCSEQTLAPGGICNLGSINLTQFINEDRTGFDLEKLATYTRYLVRFLDNVNTISKTPLPEYDYSMKNKRRVGCGVLGWGSSLYILKTKFAGEKAAKLRDEVMSTIARSAYMASIDLAKEKDMFSECDPYKHVENPFIKKLNLPNEYVENLLKYGIRNSSLLSIQPTGNTSTMTNITSGGLEPIFLPEYIRTVIVPSMPDHISDVTPKWYEGEWHETEMFKFHKEGDEQILKGKDEFGIVYKIDRNRGLTKEVLCQDYGVRHLSKLGEWDPSAEWAVTTENLTADDHINDLIGFSNYLDASASKTVNLPFDYPFEDFKDIYLKAYKSGVVRGVTTYRSGTMTTVLSARDEKTATCEDEEIILEDVKLADTLPATVKKLKAEGRRWYLTVIHDPSHKRPVALFVQTNHSEKNATTNDAVDRLINLAYKKGIPERHVTDIVDKMKHDSNTTKLARATSLLLRHGVLIKNIVAVINSVDNVYAGQFLFALQKFLASYIKDGEKATGVNCQNCGSDQIVYSEGCFKCLQCSASKCG